ncbi:ABC transporter ATP-binding protein [Haploplasma axanthum]|uniref:ABC-type multidrug/protein/lipid transport system ATPase component n=1 Tax=Haploplasma axanthum TaxID=29552 RepID=A0A449BBM5_HAPAX|nr:ABC transporter ATP-binding protein [Haploplasma axanthum]VEU79585.1 ABC-type multidrug/protein/lipid transport system ATPase component [Haploplasma axanthum]
MIELIMNLRAYSKNAKKWLFLNIITAFIGNLFILVNPLIIGFIVKKAVGVSNVDFNYIIKYLILVGILYLLGTMLLWFSQVCSHNYATIITRNLRNHAFHTITHTPISYLDRTQTGDIMARFSQDIDLVFDALSHFFMYFFQGATTILFSLGIMIYLNIWLTLVVVAMVPVIFIYSNATKTKRNQRFVVLQKLIGELTGTAKEYFDEKKLIQAYNYQENAKQKFDKLNDELTVVGEKAYFAASINNPTYRLFTNISYALLGLVSILLTINGHKVEVATLTSMIMYSAMFARPFNDFSVLTANFMAGRAGLKRITEVLELNVELEKIPFEFNDRAVLGNIDFNDVEFAYTKNQKLITDFNLKVKRGQKVAIVGPTGAGKSTMINLLMRFYDVNNGAIIVDGKDIRDYNRKALRLSFGLVLQEPWLFNGTIESNLKYGRKDATDEEMIEAAKKANCHDFIMNLKDGYKTRLSDSTNLSVGQKQLLTIARAILIDPPILILDEATSNIDSLMEQEIQTTFARVMKGKTTFIIAHRLKTIVDSDIIIAMDKGNIVEYGTHEELMNKDAFYAKLYMSQFAKDE